MKKIFLILIFGALAFLSTLSVVHAQQSCDADTTNSERFARHEYTIYNTGSCSFSFTITPTYSTTGDTTLSNNTLVTSGSLGAGQSLAVGYLRFRTPQCGAGTADSSIHVSVTASCGTDDADAGPFHTTFCGNCQPTQYWCTPDSGQTTCPNSGTTCPPGVQCFTDVNQCNAGAAQRCAAPQPTKCYDSNNDGRYDQCGVNGTGPSCTDANFQQVCVNNIVGCDANNMCAQGGDRGACPAGVQIGQSCIPPVTRCNAQNQCTANGTGIVCSTDADCVPSVTRCNTSNQCTTDGTGVICSTNADCAPAVTRCNAQNQCTINGTGSVCTSNADCVPPVTRCNASNQCTANGTGAICSTNADCAPPPVTRCNNQNQCVVNGTGAICTTNADCAPPVTRCNAQNQCVANGTGILCSTSADCNPPPQTRCNASNQCTTNGTGAICTTNADCTPQISRCNDNDQCVLNGTGIVCSSDAVCRNRPRCNDQNQCTQGGNGILCGNDQQCINRPRCNDQNQCTPGGIGILCDTASQCQNQPRCNDQNQCALGGTGIACSNSSQCQNQPRCNDQNQCVQGGNGILCTNAQQCANRPRCNDQRQCVTGGTGQLCAGDVECQSTGNNKCGDTNSDGTYDSCDVTGTGPACTTVAECTAIRGCNQQRQCVNGGTGSSCTNDTQCQGGPGGFPCNTVCVPNVTVCDTGLSCLSTADGNRCRLPANPSSNTCSTNGGPGGFPCNTVCVPNVTVCDTGLQCLSTADGNRCRLPVNPSSNTCSTNGGPGGFPCNTQCNGGIVCNPGLSCIATTDQGQRCRDTRYPNSSTCQSTSSGSNFCGDGTIQRPNGLGQYEECDDGNTRNDNNGCSADCKLQSTGQPPVGCQACGCVDKSVDPAIAGDNQSVTYTIIISNKSEVSGFPFTPYQIVVRDTIWQKKKFKNNDPLQGVDTFQSTEGFIDYPDQICISSNPSGAIVNGNLTSGCFAFQPGVNVGDPSILSGANAPTFRIENLRPGNQITFTYQGTAQTDTPGHALNATTQFIDITNEVRTQTNNDYATVTVSKPYLSTSNSGNAYIGSSGLTSTNVTNLNLAVVIPDRLTYDIRNIAGLIISTLPKDLVQNVSTYLTTLGTYAGFTTTNIAASIDKTTENIIKNSTPSGANVRILSEANFAGLLGTRPDKARIYTADNGLTIDAALTLNESTTIVVKEGDLTINADIRYANTPNKKPSIAFVVLNGNFIIDKDVEHLDGVYIVKDPTKKVLSNGQSLKKLTINGSLYGNTNDLIKARTFVGLPEEGGASVAINYDARILSNTPPGLKDILGQILFQQIAK